MKKIAVALSLLVLVAFSPRITLAQGGFTGPGGVEITVQEAKLKKDLPPGATNFFVLRGQIVREIEDWTYLFRDNTGEIVILISDGTWNGVVIDQNDFVEIKGRILFGWTTDNRFIVSSIFKIS
ncbi:MAG: NirD/YgiW/YdeI family stress tolerance protein [Deltaproteobacteria bacterium]|jgi:uncharacterized protein (TIGR00156 family)|nr:NirD/YgiW/YdeI family stress tolerance protein [Deltaproteobacteria bacterium]